MLSGLPPASAGYWYVSKLWPLAALAFRCLPFISSFKWSGSAFMWTLAFAFPDRQKAELVANPAVGEIDGLPRCHICSFDNNNLKCQSWSPSARHFRRYLKWINCPRLHESSGTRDMTAVLLAHKPITYSHLHLIGKLEISPWPSWREQRRFTILIEIWWQLHD